MPTCSRRHLPLAPPAGPLFCVASRREPRPPESGTTASELQSRQRTCRGTFRDLSTGHCAALRYVSTGHCAALRCVSTAMRHVTRTCAALHELRGRYQLVRS
eukprot:2278297-Rhodomonas_salina.1